MRDYWVDLAAGKLAGQTAFYKFGYNAAVGTSLEPICAGGFYRTPTSVTSLEVVSDDANDTAAGTGAQEVTINYLDATGAEQSQTAELNGATPVALSSDCLRVFRWYVSRSGAYASQSTPSQLGTLTLQESGGGNVWSQIIEPQTSFGAGQSLIGAYTVPVGKELIVRAILPTVAATQAVDLLFFKRENILDTSSPYTGTLRVQSYLKSVGDVPAVHEVVWYFDELTDIGFMGKTAAGSAQVSVEYWGTLLTK